MKKRGNNARADGRPGAAASGGALLAAALALLAPAARAGEAPPAPPARPPAAHSRLHDLELTVLARRALRQDPRLAPLKVGVLVHNGVATLWGPVPTAEDVRRAVKSVESVPGVASVRSELRLEKPQPENLLALPLPEDPPTQTSTARPDPASGSLGTLTRRDPSRPPPPPPPPPAVALPGPVAAPPPQAAPIAPSPANAVEALRQGDRRFRRIRAEVNGGTVSLYPGGTPREDVMAFYQVLARVPGVERVVIKNR